MNNIFEQFDEAYSRWSILDKVGKEMQLAGLWQQTSAAYNYLFQLRTIISFRCIRIEAISLLEKQTMPIR